MEKTKNFDHSMLTSIVMKLDARGIVVHDIVHIGNNVFEMCFSDNVGFLCGTYGKCQYTLENGELKLIKHKITGMS